MSYHMWILVLYKDMKETFTRFKYTLIKINDGNDLKLDAITLMTV